MSKPKDHWTKRELTLRQGVKELAKAVIEQWILDGKPECDAEVIKLWENIANFKMEDNT